MTKGQNVPGKKIVIVAFDVSNMTDEETESLEFAARVQYEAGDDYPDANGVESVVLHDVPIGLLDTQDGLQGVLNVGLGR